jgi:hypothetical protein
MTRYISIATNKLSPVKPAELVPCMHTGTEATGIAGGLHSVHSNNLILIPRTPDAKLGSKFIYKEFYMDRRKQLDELLYIISDALNKLKSSDEDIVAAMRDAKDLGFKVKILHDFVIEEIKESGEKDENTPDKSSSGSDDEDYEDDDGKDRPESGAKDFPADCPAPNDEAQSYFAASPEDEKEAHKLGVEMKPEDIAEIIDQYRKDVSTQFGGDPQLESCGNPDKGGIMRTRSDIIESFLILSDKVTGMSRREIFWHMLYPYIVKAGIDIPNKDSVSADMVWSGWMVKIANKARTSDQYIPLLLCAERILKQLAK